MNGKITNAHWSLIYKSVLEIWSIYFCDFEFEGLYLFLNSSYCSMDAVFLPIDNHIGFFGSHRYLGFSYIILFKGSSNSKMGILWSHVIYIVIHVIGNIPFKFVEIPVKRAVQAWYGDCTKLSGTLASLG